MTDTIIGYVHGASVDGVFLDSLMAILHEDRFRTIEGCISIESGPLLVTARNVLVEAFLETGKEWLLMVDTDMELPTDVVDRLKRHASPDRVVGALCFAFDRRSRGMAPTMYVGERLTPVTEWEPGALVPVWSTGAACLLIHRDVFAKLERPWFRQSTDGSYGEDQGFCMNLALAGIELAVDTSTVAGHSKGLVVGLTDWTGRSKMEA